MKLKKVLIVFKKSTYQLQAVEYKEPRFIKLVDQGHSTVTKVKIAHEEHYETLNILKNELAKRKIEYSEVARVDLKNQIKEVDLVISVGGDGTFLDASHSIVDVPLLGINSSSSSSFGHFCLGNKSNIAQVLSDIHENKIHLNKLLRLSVSLNNELMPVSALNEILICHSNPAGTSRYYLSVKDLKEEEHRSSGIWVGTAAGSTGAIRAAGGEVLPITSKSYQYIVREPWMRPGQKFQYLKEMLKSTDQMKIVSHMRTASVYVDGQHIEYTFGLGDEIIVSASKNDLFAYIDPNVNDVFVNA